MTKTVQFNHWPTCIIDVGQPLGGTNVTAETSAPGKLVETPSTGAGANAFTIFELTLPFQHCYIQDCRYVLDTSGGTRPTDFWLLTVAPADYVTEGVVLATTTNVNQAARVHWKVHNAAYALSADDELITIAKHVSTRGKDSTLYLMVRNNAAARHRFIFSGHVG